MATEDEHFDGPAGEYTVCPCVDGSKGFEVHDDHAGNLIAKTEHRGAAVQLAKLLAESRFIIKPLRDSAD